MTPGNPLALLNMDTSTSGDGSNAEPIGVLDRDLLIYQIKRGGMGEVFLCGIAEGQQKKPSVALKTFQKRFFFDRATREGFVRECVIWSRLSGIPHIMIVLNIRMIEHRPFVVMPAIRDKCASVADMLKSGKIKALTALHFAWQTAFALRAAQERLPGLVHGDLKPDNLLLYQDAVFVSDFGIARLLNQEGGTSALEGTWAYRAPEVWKDPEQLSVSSDVYAFGVLLYEMIAGRLPFDASSAVTWRAAHDQKKPAQLKAAEFGELGAELSNLAIQCMAKRPQIRPPNFDAILQILSKVGEKHDVVDQFVLMVDTLRWRDVLDGMKHQFQLSLVRSLASIDLPEIALDLFQDYPEALVVGEAAMLRGTLLSLNGRDEEAIRFFDRAMRSELDSDTFTRCMAEKGLSLKRLGRISEAIALYEALLDQTSDRFNPGIVVNFATALLTAKEFTRARDILTNFIRRNPNLPEAWANLGLAYDGTQEDVNAIEAYKTAIRLDPSRANIQVMLAEALLRSGHVQEAIIFLDAAYDQGYQSRQWVICAIAAHGLLGRSETVSMLLAAVERDLGTELNKQIQEQAMELLKQGAAKMLALAEGQRRKSAK